MNKPKIAYLVSSHFSYAPFTVPILCPSLLNSGVPVEDIFMVVCGCRREFDVKTSQGNFWYVEHESRNFCVFVEAIAERRAEALKDYTHIFLLLDTCRAGPQFYFLSNQFDSSKDAIGANAFINNGCQSDIGAYRLEYLHSKSSVIAAYKNCEPLANYVWEGRMFAEATEKYFYGKNFHDAVWVLDYVGLKVFTPVLLLNNEVRNFFKPLSSMPMWGGKCQSPKALYYSKIGHYIKI